MADNNGLVPTQEKKKGFFYVLTHWRKILGDAEEAQKEVKKAKEEAEKAKADAEKAIKEAKEEAEKAIAKAQKEAKKAQEEAEKVKKDYEAKQQRQAEQGERLSKKEQELDEVASVFLSRDDKEGISKDERISRGAVIKRFKDLLSQEISDCDDKVMEIKKAQKIDEKTLSEKEGLDEAERAEKLKEIRSDSKKEKIMALKMMQVKILAHTAVYIDRGEKTDETRAIQNRIVQKIDSICKDLDFKSAYELRRQYISTILEDTGFSKGFEQVIEQNGAGDKWCLARYSRYNFPNDRIVQPVDLFGFYYKCKNSYGKMVEKEENGLVQESGYTYTKMENFVKYTPSELITIAQRSLTEAGTRGLRLAGARCLLTDEAIVEIIQKNLTDVGYASARHLNSLGFKKVNGADDQIQSFNADDGR